MQKTKDKKYKSRMEWAISWARMIKELTFAEFLVTFHRLKLMMQQLDTWDIFFHRNSVHWSKNNYNFNRHLEFTFISLCIFWPKSVKKLFGFDLTTNYKKKIKITVMRRINYIVSVNVEARQNYFQGKCEVWWNSQEKWPFNAHFSFNSCHFSFTLKDPS